MEYSVDDSDRSSSPPPTPTDKPLRSKRGHRQKTPPPGAQSGSAHAGAQQPSPGSMQQHPMMHAMNPMSSAQSTPDPSRTGPFFNNIPPSLSSPHAVNGNSLPPPPLHPQHLPPLQHQRLPEPSRGAYYDPTQDERPMENESAYSERQRTHSGAHAPPSEPRDVQNGERRDQDVEMEDASGSGFHSINRG